MSQVLLAGFIYLFIAAAAAAKSLQWLQSQTSVVSDSVRPQRRQPTRLPHPWDSPGKNTGVGCHFLLQCVKLRSESEVTQLCPTLSNPMDCSPPGSSIHGIFQAATPQNMLDRISLTTDWTCAPWIGRWILNHWFTREAFPWCFLTSIWWVFLLNKI